MIIYLINYSGNYNGEKLYVFGVLCSFCFGGYLCLDNFCVDGSDSISFGFGIFFGSGSGDFLFINIEIINIGYGDVFGKINLVNWIFKKVICFIIIVIIFR